MSNFFNFTVAYYLCICVYDSDAFKSYSHNVHGNGRTARNILYTFYKINQNK
jgi:hypothetical protein